MSHQSFRLTQKREREKNKICSGYVNVYPLIGQLPFYGFKLLFTCIDLSGDSLVLGEDKHVVVQQNLWANN